MTDVGLRPLEDADLDALFEYMRDAESVWLAAFTAKDPNDRAAFDAHMAKIRQLPDADVLAVTVDGRFVGTIGSYVIEGDREVTYWIDRAVWGQGVATSALAQYLSVLTVRPLHARVAAGNQGSLRVLEKVGFKVTGTDSGYANGRAAEIEESILLLP